ncbi:hypothetical protein EC973_000533 [Apophysomyces ossiformis]|uniref:Uncharacterized protein n=1 Tax=Apophysomyces ossiformis TaxID=679940 RepID=A0A8H7EP53_9FUNG|nr:hypothetical protein EC973_000533 [Apophysomyces ossiformis]
MSKHGGYIAIPTEQTESLPTKKKNAIEECVVTTNGDNVTYTFGSRCCEHQHIFKWICCGCFTASVLSILIVVIILLAAAPATYETTEIFDPPDVFLYGGSFEARDFMNELLTKFGCSNSIWDQKLRCLDMHHRHPNHFMGNHRNNIEEYRELPTHHRGPIFNDDAPIPPENHRELPTHHRGPIFNDDAPIPPENHRELPTHNRGPIFNDDAPIPPENHRELPTHRRYHPHTDMTTDTTKDLMVNRVQIFTFLPEEFGKFELSIADRFMHHGGQVVVRQALNSTEHHVSVNVTLLASSEDALQAVKATVDDRWGTFSVNVKRKHPRHHKDHINKHGRLSYKVDIEFPANLWHYDMVKLHLRHADIVQTKNLNVKFHEFEVGVGRGAIVTQDLHASQIRVGVLDGHIRGGFSPSMDFIAACLHGTSNVTILQNEDFTTMTAFAIHGDSYLSISDKFSGPFTVEQATLGHNQLVSARNDVNMMLYEASQQRWSGVLNDGIVSRLMVRSQNGEAGLQFY